ncbi:B12-binding domain-containing protein [Thermodesulfobacteriota bacterium]
MSKELIEAITEMNEPEALRLAGEMIAVEENAMKVIDHCREALTIVGQRFEKGIYFLPELILAGEMLSQISDMAKEKMPKDSHIKRLGKVVIGTVKGDVHDIGKNIVTFMLDVNGFEVHDIGVDVTPQKFIDKIKEEQPEIVGLSGFLTAAFDSMKRTIEAVREAGLRDRVKIMIGGGLVSNQIKDFTGADAYGEDAVAAVTLAKAWTRGN